MIKGEDCSFTKHMRIKSRLIIRRNLSRYQSPCPSFFENQKDPFRVSISSFWIWALLSSTYFFGFILYLFHFDFSLFRYRYPLGTAFASIENFFLCMNRYYSIPISSRNFPRKIPNWIQNWRVSVSLSMRLCTLEIGINFLILAFVLWWIVLDPFDDLCCVEGISIWSDRLRKARGSNGTGESIQKK